MPHRRSPSGPGPRRVAAPALIDGSNPRRDAIMGEPHGLDIPVLLGSARHGRRSDLVAGLVFEHLRRRPQVAARLFDLATLDLPIMRRRGSEADPPPVGYREF